MAKITFQQKYGVTPDAVLNSLEITFKAKGLYGFIQSKPDGWRFSAYRISKQGKDGIDSVKSGLQELEEAGLLERIKYQNKKGEWLCDYILKEPAKALGGISTKGKSNAGKSNEGKAANISKTESSKTESRETDESLAAAEATAGQSGKKFSQQGAEIIEAFIAINPACAKMYGNKTQRQACDDLIEMHGFEVILNIVRNVLPRTNDMPYITTITTPKQLLDKYATLASQVRSSKNQSKAKAPVFM